MIVYLVTNDYQHTVWNFLDTWGSALQGRIRIQPWEELTTLTSLPVATYIFADLDRLTQAQVELAAQVWDRLAEARDTGALQMRLLNHPLKVQRRVELLTRLHAAGRNCFRTFYASELGSVDIRFPAFLRKANDHAGNLSVLVHDPTELDKALVPAVMRGHRLDDIVVVEFCDTRGDDGLYRKYSAFCVGGQIIPRHEIFSREWMLKTPDIVTDDLLAEERDYLDGNPHREDLEDVFSLAGVDYGRIDYGVLDGAVQVWEINTNPVVMLRPEEYDSHHMTAQEWFRDRIIPAFEAIDCPATSGTVAIHIDPDLARTIEEELVDARRLRRRRHMVRAMSSHAAVRSVRAALRPVVKGLSPWLARQKRKKPE